MKKLSNKDWSLMARYVTGEAGPEEQEQLKALYAQQVGLEAWIDALRADHAHRTANTVTDFDANAAFTGLDERIQNENLL